MRTKLSLIAVLIFSGYSWSAETSDVFVTLDKSWVHSTQKIEVSNMPRERDQGATDFCPGFGFQIVLQHAYCAENKIDNCASIPPEKELVSVSS
jgi:hypothetical protein